MSSNDDEEAEAEHLQQAIQASRQQQQQDANLANQDPEAGPSVSIPSNSFIVIIHHCIIALGL